MTAYMPENFSTWLVDRSRVNIVVNTMPPRDPNDDDDDEEDEDDEDDEDDEKQPDEPAVVREPEDDE